MSLQFDAEYYLTNNPDVAEAVQNGVIESAEAHWEMYGADEGRNPNAVFNTEEYLAANPDVADAFAKGIINPLDHFLQYGAAEGRAPSAAYQNVAANFDNDAYLAANTDVAEAVDNGVFASGYEHWVEYGQFEETRTGAQLTDGTPADEAIGEEATTELTTEVDTLTGTAADDIFSGVSSALSSARTLNAGDSIDGGDGNDTLSVDLQSTFSGFNADGGLTSVENLELNNAGSIARGFDASGIEGLEQVTLNGDVNLTNVETAGITLALADIAEGSTGVEFTADAIKGKSDSLALALENVGTVADEENDVAEQAVAITANGIESLSVAAEGDNVVDLSGIAATDATVTGSGNLTVTAVNAKLETFDASAAEGDVDADLSDAGSLGSVTTGAGDDTLSIDTDSLTANAMIDGGEGDNTLALSGSSAKATQYQLANVQTLSLGDFNGGALTFSARDTSGLETVAAGSDFNGSATLAKLGNQDLTLDLSGDNTKAGTLTADHSGTTVIDVSASATAKASDYDSHNASLTLTQSSAVDLTVGELTDYVGTITAQKAQSIEADVAGNINDTINAGSATGAVFNVTNSADNASSHVTLNAQKLVDLNVTTAGNFDMSGSALGALESLTVDTDGKFQIGSLGAINVVNLSGTGSATLGDLGDSRDTYGITVNAEGLNDGLTLSTITTNGTDIDVNAADVQGDVTLNGAVNAGTGNVDLDLANVAGKVTLNDVTGNNVAIDVTDVLGTVDYNGTISVANNVTLNGAELSANTDVNINASGNSVSATLNGGIQADSYTLNLNSTSLKNVDLNGDLGIQGNSGSDSLTVNLADDTDDNASTATYNVAGVESLAFDWGDSASGDTLTLNGSSSLAGVDTLTVHNGTLDISAVAGADAFAGSNIVIGSGVKMTAAQFANVLNVTTTSTDARIDIKIDTAEQAQQVAEVLDNLSVSGTTTQLSNIGLQVAQSVVTNTTALNALKAAAEKQASKVTQETVNDAGETTDTDVSGTLTVQEALDAQIADTLADDYSIEDTAAAIQSGDSDIVAGASKVIANMTDGDDTFTTDSSSEVTDKLTLNGGEGTDTLAATLDAGFTYPGSAPTLNGVENVELTAKDSANVAIGLMMTNATGVEKIADVASTSNLTVTDVQNAVELGASGVGSITPRDFAVRYAEGLTDIGTQTLSLDDAHLNLLTVTTLSWNGVAYENVSSGITSLDIALTGNNSIATFDEKDANGDVTGDLAASLTTLNISGGGSLTIDEALAVTTINADDATGNLDLSVAGADSDASVTLGSGNDTITGGAGNDTITGGAGDDIIDLTADGSGSDTLNYALGTDGDDTILGFRAGSAGGNITAVDTSEEDIISITGVNDLDTQIQNITFTNNGGYEGTPIDGKTVDATINFVNGGSITFADFLDSGTDVSSLLPNSGSLTSNSEVSDDTVIEGADEVITVTGISAVDLNTAFGGSFQVA